MNHLANYHQHSFFCDGKASMEDFVKEAVSKKFHSLGFSSHAPAPYANESMVNFDWMMNEEDMPAYITEFQRLKEHYKGQIELYLGLEADYFDANLNPSVWRNKGPFDYIIGSVHMVRSNLTTCGFAPMDSAGVVFNKLIEENGSAEKFYRHYYRTVMEMIETGGFDVVGHLDLIDKSNQDKAFYDYDSPDYHQCIGDVFALAVEKNILIEINTGYMSRRHFKEPFPRFSLIKKGLAMGVSFCLTSDCHHLGQMDFAFDEIKRFMAEQKAPLHYFSNGAFRPVNITV